MTPAASASWNDVRTSAGHLRRAFTLEEVAEMLQEPVSTIRVHCQTQALRGAYKTGGRTSPWRIPPKAIDHYQATRPNR